MPPPVPIGWSVGEAWHGLPARFPTLELIAFIAMPDHVHGLLASNAMADPTQPPPGLGRIVSVFKSVATHAIRQRDGRVRMTGPVFQRGFPDRVVRSDDEMRQIEGYIAENPARWAASRMTSDSAGSGVGLA